MKIYQIWYETSVGPAFSTKEAAIEYLNDGDGFADGFKPIVLPEIGFAQRDGYPEIKEITLGDEDFSRDH